LRLIFTSVPRCHYFCGNCLVGRLDLLLIHVAARRARPDAEAETRLALDRKDEEVNRLLVAKDEEIARMHETLSEMELEVQDLLAELDAAKRSLRRYRAERIEVDNMLDFYLKEPASSPVRSRLMSARSQLKSSRFELD
jgi:KaiC/GvpD/RAD55 family RecA-like ATPase